MQQVFGFPSFYLLSDGCFPAFCEDRRAERKDCMVTAPLLLGEGMIKVSAMLRICG